MNDDQYKSLKDHIQALGYTDDEANTLIDALETESEENRKIDLETFFDIQLPYQFGGLAEFELDMALSTNIHLEPINHHTLQPKQLQTINPNLVANFKLKLDKPTRTYPDIKINTLNAQSLSLPTKIETLNVFSEKDLILQPLRSIDVTSSIANIGQQLNHIPLQIQQKSFIKKDKSLTVPKNMMNKPMMKREFRPKAYLDEPQAINTLIELPSLPRKVEISSHEAIEQPNIELPTEDIKTDYERELKSIGLDIELDDTIPMISVASYYMDNVEVFRDGTGISRHYQAFKGFYRPFIDDIAQEVYQAHYQCNDPIQLFELFKSRINDVIEEISEMYMEQDVQEYMMEG